MKFSCVYVPIITSYIYVFCHENRRGEVMDLVYGSSSSSYMDCEVKFVMSVTDLPVWGSFNPVLLRRWPRHTWMFLLRFSHLQDEC